jgi:hypothetical protein
MMNHHPQVPGNSSVAILVTHQVGHFWKADPGHSLKAPKLILMVGAEGFEPPTQSGHYAAFFVGFNSKTSLFQGFARIL